MSKEVKDLLVEYCEWCKAQGGQCQLNLDGCAVGEALAILKEQPPAGELAKRLRAGIRLRDNRDKCGDPVEVIIDIKLINEACTCLDRSEAGERILEERIEKLSDTLDRSEASREELLMVLERYGEHETGCMLGDACNCGLKAAIAKAQKEGGE